MYIVYETGDECPICKSILEEKEYGEDEDVYIECPKDESHYSRYIGMREDLDQ